VHCLLAYVIPLHCVVFLFAENDDDEGGTGGEGSTEGEGGTDIARGRLGATSSRGRERTPTDIEGQDRAPGERSGSE
jgi:hypothetical protein